jgi:Ca2+-binding RTX toxin-like protein
MRIALVLALLLALTAPGHASTVRFTEDYGWCRDFCGKIGGQPDTVVVYDAAPGEANRLTVGRDGHAITLTDPGAAVRVVPPCVALDPHTASCDSDNFGDLAADWASVRLGDGDDSASVTAGDAVLSGGPGRDTLLGGEGQDTLDGGPDADRIDGGGSAWNRLSFRSRRAPVTVDLTRGRTSDGDTLANIRSVSGGHGADRLVGWDATTSSTAARETTSWRGGAARTRCSATGEPTAYAAVRVRTICSAASAATSCPAAPVATSSRAVAGGIWPGSTRKTVCTLAKPGALLSILDSVDHAFPHSSAAHSLTPRRTAIA